MSVQNPPQGGGGSGGAANQQNKVSFSVKIDYMVAALRDDIRENWEIGQLPPPLMYPTATVNEAYVPAFVRSYIGQLIYEADVAYHGHSDIAAWKNRFKDVTDDPRAWIWRVENTNYGSAASPPPAWLRSSIPQGNRWLGVRIVSPAMWARDLESIRYVRHIVHSLNHGLQLHAPEGCGMTVSVGIGKRAFSLTELKRLAAGFFVTGPLLSTLPYVARTFNTEGAGGEGQWIVTCKPNAFISTLAQEFIRTGAASKFTLDPNRDILDPEKQRFPLERRIIPRGALERPLYLSWTGTIPAPGAIAAMMASTPGESPPACDFRHYQASAPNDRDQQQQPRKTTIACRQLAATTDADSVAVWCSLVTSLADAFLRLDNAADWTGFIYCCEYAEVVRIGYDVLDLLHTLGRTDIAESIQRRVVEKPDMVSWTNLPTED
ncbi:hypothetical protein PG985_008902 [Apiospora marii]|uniref:uncharacterized protein n=1 Tax=Apiospora marii TaxID=335849 RepID=UPI00312D88BB